MIIPFIRGLKKYQWLCMINKSVNTMILWSPNDHQILGQIPSPIPSSQISANGGKDDQKNEAFETHGSGPRWMSIPGKRHGRNRGCVGVSSGRSLLGDKHVILCPVTLWPMLTDTQIYKESGRKEMLPGFSRCNNFSCASDMASRNGRNQSSNRVSMRWRNVCSVTKRVLFTR